MWKSVGKAFLGEPCGMFESKKSYVPSLWIHLQLNIKQWGVWSAVEYSLTNLQLVFLIHHSMCVDLNNHGTNSTIVHNSVQSHVYSRTNCILKSDIFVCLGYQFYSGK